MSPDYGQNWEKMNHQLLPINPIKRQGLSVKWRPHHLMSRRGVDPEALLCHTTLCLLSNLMSQTPLWSFFSSFRQFFSHPYTARLRKRWGLTLSPRVFTREKEGECVLGTCVCGGGGREREGQNLFPSNQPLWSLNLSGKESDRRWQTVVGREICVSLDRRCVSLDDKLRTNL